MFYKQFRDAIRRLSKCVLVFNKNGAETEFVRVNVYMGMSLCEENLLYSAEAYLVRAASMLVQQYSSHGSVPHLLLPVLQDLMRLELRLGRLVMYLNWNDLRNLIAVNAQENENTAYRDDYETMDAAWACLFSTSDTLWRESRSLIFMKLKSFAIALLLSLIAFFTSSITFSLPCSDNLSGKG